MNGIRCALTGWCWIVSISIPPNAAADDFGNDKYPTTQHMQELLRKLEDRKLEGRAFVDVVYEVSRIAVGEWDHRLWMHCQAVEALQNAAKHVVPRLIKALHHPEVQVRRNAAWSLGDIGPAAKEAVPALIEALGGPARGPAAWALGRIGPSAAAAVDALSRTLQDGNEEVRERAAHSLGTVGPAAEKAVPALLQAVESPDRLAEVRRLIPRVKNPDLELKELVDVVLKLNRLSAGDQGRIHSATHALACILIEKYAVPDLARALDGTDPKARVAAAEVLWSLAARQYDLKPALSALERSLAEKGGPLPLLAARALESMGPAAEHSVPVLIQALGAEDSEVRHTSAEALGAIGPAAEDAVVPLIGALADPNQQVRATAAFSLPRIGPASRPALPALIRALKDPDENVRSGAVAAIGQFVPTPKETVPSLVEVLMSEEKLSVFKAVARVLVGSGVDMTPAVACLISGLEKDDPEIRQSAAEALGHIGPEAQSAIPALAGGMQDEHTNAALSCARALWRIDRGQAGTVLPTLISGLEGEDRAHRWLAAECLGGMGKEAGAAVPLLTLALRDKEHSVRSQAARALGRIGPPARSAVPELARSLGDEKGNVAISALFSLRAIATPEVALPILTQALTHDDRYVAGGAARFLAKHGAEAGPAIPALMKNLRAGSDRYLATSSATALAAIGTEAVPPLIQALRDRDALVRRCAAYALTKMGKDAVGAVEALQAALEDENQDVREQAAEALKAIPASP